MTAKVPPVVYSNDQIINAATGQWGEVAHEVKPAVPYDIQVPESDKVITIAPLTRRRRKALKAAQAAYLMMGAQMVEAERDKTVDQATITRIRKVMDEAEGAYNKALFGDVADEVEAFFDDLQEEWWDAMYIDVHEKLVNRTELPEDVCSKCGQKIGDDEEEGEGKDESSSTSSTGTGRKLKAISGSTSA